MVTVYAVRLPEFQGQTRYIAADDSGALIGYASRTLLNAKLWRKRAFADRAAAKYPGALVVEFTGDRAYELLDAASGAY